jgi:hypothetical protein
MSAAAAVRNDDDEGVAAKCDVFCEGNEDLKKSDFEIFLHARYARHG